jgi:hypothetical protein
VGVELVEEQRAVEVARGLHPIGELVAGDQLAGGIAGIRNQDGRKATSENFAAEIDGAKLITSIPFEQDGDRREEAKHIEQLFVRRVIREKVAEVDVTERRRGARE